VFVSYRFINKLREPSGLATVKYQGNAHVPLVAMDNIDAFNKAAVEYGLPESFSFPSNDLYEAHKGTFYKVIRCLDQLGVEVRELADRALVFQSKIFFTSNLEVIYFAVVCVCSSVSRVIRKLSKKKKNLFITNKHMYTSNFRLTCIHVSDGLPEKL